MNETTQGVKSFFKTKSFLKAPFFYFCLISVLGLGLISLINGDSLPEDKISINYFRAQSGAFLGNLSEKLVVSKEKILFFNQKEVLLPESPDLSIVQKNSLSSVSSPQVLSLEVLGSIAGKTDSDTPIEVSEYIVEQGDNIYSLAERFNISEDTIRWANNLTSSKIKVGQKLVILPVSGVLHSVNSGDTLSEIAETYNAKLNQIVAFNSLEDKNDIFIGDVLIVPGGEMPAVPPSYQQIPLASSYFIFPTKGKVTQGPHWPPRYNAIDIANKCGTPIYAAAKGKVYQIGYFWPGGKFVKILHPNGAVTYYGHFDQIFVAQGQQIYQGQTIGTMGYTGYTYPRGPAGCHLHFDVFGARNPLLKYSVGSFIGY